VQAVILAAGRGSRLEPVTNHIPKPLIPFWGRPFLAYLLDNLEGLVDEAIIVDNPEGEVEAVFGDSYGSLPLRHLPQPEPRGTGDAVLQARGCVDEPFIVVLADTCPPRETIRELIEAPGDVVLTVIEVDDPENHGGVDVDDDGRVSALWTDSPMADAGMVRVTGRIYDRLESVEPLRGELRILQGVQEMIRAGDDVRAIVMPGPWLQFGDHEHLEGVLRVMGQIRNGHPGDARFMDASVDVAACDGCEIQNSLVFGPGELVDCKISNSMIYCATRLEGVEIDGKMAAFEAAGDDA